MASSFFLEELELLLEEAEAVDFLLRPNISNSTCTAVTRWQSSPPWWRCVDRMSKISAICKKVADFEVRLPWGDAVRLPLPLFLSLCMFSHHTLLDTTPSPLSQREWS
jgi:hypothetical protein